MIGHPFGERLTITEARARACGHGLRASLSSRDGGRHALDRQRLCMATLQRRQSVPCCSVGNLCRGCTRVTSAPSSVSPLSESATENSSGNALSASSASCTACVVDECLQNERIPPRPAPEHSRYRRGYDFKVLIAGLASAHMSHHERAVKSRLLPYSAYVAEGSLAGSLGAPSVCACRMRSASSLRRWRSRSLRSSSFLSLYACQTCLIFPCAHAERSLHSRLSRSVSYCRILCRAFRASIPYQPIFIPSPQKLADSNRRCSHHRPRDTSKHLAAPEGHPFR